MRGGSRAIVKITQSKSLGYTLSVYLWLYRLCWALDGGSARRKAATCTQDSTDTE
jgi:hypothetical protein